LTAPGGNSMLYSTGLAKIGNFGNGAVRIRHREFVADVNGTATGLFTVLAYPVNPGIAMTFPWLSTLASRFEKYRFNSLVFNYVSSCAVITVGTVLAAYDTDAADNQPLSKPEIMTYQNAARSPCWGAFTSHLPKVGEGHRYIRRNAQPVGTDIKTYDVANFFVGTSGTTAAGQVGELYVEYDVVLEVPHTIDLSASSAITSLNLTAGQPWAASAGIYPVISGSLSMAIYTAIPSNLILYATPGTSYLMVFDLKGSGFGTLGFTPLTLGGAAFTLLGTVSNTTTATSITAAIAFTVDAVASGQTGTAAVLNNGIAIQANSSTGTLNPGGATFSISPWQPGLAFP